LYATGYSQYTPSYGLQQQLAGDGYQIWRNKNDGSYIVTNDAFDVVQEPLYYIDPDTNSAVFINGKRSYAGSLDGVNEQSSYYNLYSDALDYFNQKYNKNYINRDFNLKNDYSKNNLVNKLAESFRNKNYSHNTFSYADVSRMFEGTTPVLAFHEDGSGLQINHGIPNLKDKSLKFMWQDGTGIHIGTLE
jgi:hypothetical protein